MKKLIVVFVVGLLSASFSFAAEPSLSEEINDKVIIDLSNVELDQYSQDYVLVSFKIVSGQIIINGVRGTQAILKKMIVKELSSMRIESNYEPNATYRYKFTFKKV